MPQIGPQKIQNEKINALAQLSLPRKMFQNPNMEGGRH